MAEIHEFRLPATAYELIDELDKAYPHECIRDGESLEAAHRRAGARELIDQLLQARRDQEEEAAESMKVLSK